MYGRYGSDALNKFLLGVSVALMVLWIPTRWGALSWVVLALLVLTYFRMLSRNVQARYAENQRFLTVWSPVQRRFSDAAFRLRDRKTHCYYKCPSCSMRLRVPRGRGKINIKCSKCGTQFVKKT